MRLSNACLGVSMVVVTCVLAGCPFGDGGGGDTLPAQATQCPADIQDKPATERTVEMGDAVGTTFEPWTDGEGIPMLHGGQGASMITPAIRVEADPAEGDEACYRVRLENDYQGQVSSFPDAKDALQVNVHFTRQGDFFVSDGDIYDALSYPQVDRPLQVIAQVIGNGFQGTRAVKVVLK